MGIAQGHGQHGDVAIVIRCMRRRAQAQHLLAGTFDLRLRPDQLLGGQFGRDPGAARIPATAEIHAHLDLQPVRLSQRVAKELAPPFAHEHLSLRRVRSADARVEEQNPGDALLPHGFEVGRDAFAAGRAVEPPPIGPGLS